MNQGEEDVVICAGVSSFQQADFIFRFKSCFLSIKRVL